MNDEPGEVPAFLAQTAPTRLSRLSGPGDEAPTPSAGRGGLAIAEAPDRNAPGAGAADDLDGPAFDLDDLFDIDHDPLGVETGPLARVLTAVDRVPWRVIGVAAVVLVAGAAAQFWFFRADSDSAQVSTIGLRSEATSTTTSPDGVEPGADTVRTGPGLATAAELETGDETGDEVGDEADGGAEPEAGAESESAAAASDQAPADQDASGGSSTDAAAPGPPVASGGVPTGDGTAATPSPTGGPTPSPSTGAPGSTTPGGSTATSTPAASTPSTAAPAPGGAAVSRDYRSNLDLIQGQSIRNRNEDGSSHRDTPSAQLVPENHYGPRSDYLIKHDGNREPAFPVEAGGQFRVACEFSHFAYDDPLVYPGRPGASHLHMFFGNTDTNAYSTADSIKNSGASTCNGGELNRTAYWVPALFDNKGNVRIPERIVVYYKGEGRAKERAEVFPEGAAMITSVDLNTVHPSNGGAQGKYSFNCSDNYSGLNRNLSNTMPVCDGNLFQREYGTSDPYTVLEVNVKFPQCWNGQDPTNPANYRHPSSGGWYFSNCEGEFNHTLVNLEYFVNYRVEQGETTEGWYLSSDIGPADRTLAHTPGSTNHGDWWSGWHDETNRMFIENCVRFRTNTASGCGFGYLTNGGPDNGNPYPGPALQIRQQYLGPMTVKATDLHAELCPQASRAATAQAAAFCTPATGSTTSAPAGSGPAPAPHSPNALFCPVHRGMLAADPASPLSSGT